MAAAQSVGTGEGDDFLVVEAHATKDVAQMVAALSGVGQTAIRRAERDIAIVAAWSEGNDGALHLLNGGDAAQDPEIGVGDPGELGCSRTSEN